MSYLVLHIDVEFIVGTVCADNGTSSPILNGKEDLLWLYFFNNPHQNSISYGKDNKPHFNNLEVNYYGKFFEKIEKEQEKFVLRGIEHPVIDLLKESGLLENIRKTYQQKTLDNTENIPTLLTFSLTVGDNAKQKMVDYLGNHGFRIDSYTIPLAELVSYYALTQKSIKNSSGSVALFLEATNSTLHLMKLSLSDNYFLMDGKPASWRGKGIDPRKRALVKFVVNEVNKATGVLSTENEKEDECERLEMQADEWLKRLDALTRNIPLRISAISFAKAPNMRKDVMVRKDDLNNDTGQYTQDLKDIFDAYKSDNVRGNVATVFFLGNCFQGDRVKSSFEQMLGADKLFFYANKDIRDILSMYPEIDITRYAGEENRIKERAKAEELKQAEQRALEDKQRKETEAEAAKFAAEQQAEKNRKEAKKLFERAEELLKEEKLHDALSNIENAIEKYPGNAEYSHLKDVIKDKLSELKIRTEQYKSLLNKAEKSVHSDDLESALNVYELAKDIFDSAEIRNTILELKDKIKQREKLRKTVNQLYGNAELLFNQGKLSEAKDILKQLLAIDSEHKEAKKILKAIDKTLQEIETGYKTLVKEADKCLNESRFDAATIAYKEALKIKSNDEYCLKQLKVAADKKASIKPPPPPPPPPPSATPKTVNVKPAVASPVAPPPPPIPVKPKPATNSGTNGTGAIKPPPPSTNVPPPANTPKSRNAGKSAPPPPPPPPPSSKKK
jgi:tetratricopeptide (TPR) repeat protein